MSEPADETKRILDERMNLLESIDKAEMILIHHITERDIANRSASDHVKLANDLRQKLADTELRIKSDNERFAEQSKQVDGAISCIVRLKQQLTDNDRNNNIPESSNQRVKKPKIDRTIDYEDPLVKAIQNSIHGNNHAFADMLTTRLSKRYQP
jgi:hypothetical protein